MKTLGNPIGICVLFMAAGIAVGQNLSAVNQQWERTLSAVQRGDHNQAGTDFAAFNAMARSYVASNGRNWQIEYLVGSLDCLFPDAQNVGAEFLQDILQNNKTLNNQGTTELRRQIVSCSSGARAVSATAQLTLPQNLTEDSAHYQSPGIHGDMKGGGEIRVDAESSAAVSPVNASELLARRVSVDDPQKALQNALTRLPEGATGAVTEEFAVTMIKGSSAQAKAIGQCLKSYATALDEEFQIDSPAFMVTVYAVPDEVQVYDFARKTHGLNLPIGVIAYSVPEDMSLVSPASGTYCGSMAHELVHLLIKRRFPGAPAWLEEGLASEVAIASPTASTLRFQWSWRDESLRTNALSRPKVDQLLDIPWSAFNSNDLAGVSSAEATQAMAAVFIRYLDAKGKLRTVYYSVRDQHLSPDLSGFKSYKSILEEQFNMSVAAIDADFQLWFSAQASTHPNLRPLGGRLSGGVPGQYINAPARPSSDPCANLRAPTQQSPPCDPTQVPPSVGNEPPKPDS